MDEAIRAEILGHLREMVGPGAEPGPTSWTRSRPVHPLVLARAQGPMNGARWTE